MQIRELTPPHGAKKARKRVGRGHGCHVRSAGRGDKGQRSRSGGTKGPGFEGGQTPWYRRLPKFRGFKNRNKKEYQGVPIFKLNIFETGAVITPELLYEHGLIKSLDVPVKILGQGKLKKALTLRIHHMTESAGEAIAKAGGKVEVI